MTFASGSQLAQARPSGTTAVAAFSASLPTEITTIYVANTTGSAASFSLYHDDDGSTFDATTALYEAVSVAANTTTVIRASAPGGGLAVSKVGKIGVKTSTGSALTFTLYGVTANMQGR